MFVIKMNNRINKEVPPSESIRPIFNDKAQKKAMWTYQNKDIVEGYLDPIPQTKNEMIKNMTELYQILRKKNIKLSLAVYPWPQQIENDKVNSVHVKMWKEFCINKCENFINFFPFFFDEKNKTSFLEVYKRYYFWNDVHFNARGNKVIAEKLIEKF